MESKYTNYLYVNVNNNRAFEMVVQVQPNGTLKELRSDFVRTSHRDGVSELRSDVGGTLRKEGAPTSAEDWTPRTWDTLDAWTLVLMEEGKLGYITMLPPPDYVVIPIKMEELVLPPVPTHRLGLRGIFNALRDLLPLRGLL